VHHSAQSQSCFEQQSVGKIFESASLTQKAVAQMKTQGQEKFGLQMDFLKFVIVQDRKKNHLQDFPWQSKGLWNKQNKSINIVV
jgi:hypothetical protein